jgi:hypothetical protein
VVGSALRYKNWPSTTRFLVCAALLLLLLLLLEKKKLLLHILQLPLRCFPQLSARWAAAR